MHLFRKDFHRNVQHSIHISDITKRNSNVHFILGNTGHARRELTVHVNGYIFMIKFLVPEYVTDRLYIVLTTQFFFIKNSFELCGSL